MKTSSFALAGLFALALGCAVASPALADSITITLDDDWGSDPGSGSPTITFDDGGGTGSVTVTMDLSGLSSTTEFVSRWYLNSAVDPDDFTFAYEASDSTGPAASSIATTFNVKDSAFRADGDGYYDIVFFFPTSGGTFGDDEVVVYTIEGDGITASTFNVMGLSHGPGTPGPFSSAVKLQGTDGGGGSTWIGGAPQPQPVPEPGTIGLLAAGLGAIAVRARRRRV
jgi:hypothetical protein